MIKEILEKQGMKVGLVGTIATYIGGKKLEDSDRTTPESLKLQRLFRQMANEGCQAVVMEVPKVELVEVFELSDSERGDKGFGSSGVK